MDRMTPNPGPPGPPGPPGLPGEPTTSLPTYRTTQPTIRARDIGYFDPNSDKEPVEVKETHQLYHNVFSFTNQLRAQAITLDIAILHTHLPSCLIGKAERWYTEELSNITRLGLQSISIDEWCSLLERRFRDPPGKSLAVLERERYTIQDVRRQRDPTDYVQSIVLLGRNAGTATTDMTQVLMAYEHMDGQLRRDLPRPNEQSTIEGLIEEFNTLKHIWFDIYSGGQHRNEPRSEPQARQIAGPARYLRFNGSSNAPNGPTYRQNSYLVPPYQHGKYYHTNYPYRPYHGQQQHAGGYPPRPYNGQYQNQIGNRYPPQLYEATTNQPYGNPPRYTDTFNRRPLQITGGDTRIQNQQNQDDRTSNAANQPWQNCPWQNRPTERQQSQGNMNTRSTRAYYDDTALPEEATPELERYDEHLDYETYEDRYYAENAYWIGPDKQKTAEVDESDTPAAETSEEQNESTNALFNIPTTPTLAVECRRCRRMFESNNKLHKHLRDGCKRTISETGRLKTLDTMTIRSSTVNTERSADTANEQIIESNTTNDRAAGYGFRGWQYVTVKIQLRREGDIEPVCLDTGCTMSIIDRDFPFQQRPDIRIQHMASPVTVRGIRQGTHRCNAFVRLDIYLQGNPTALIHRDVHIVEDLKAKMLIGMDIMGAEGIVLDIPHRTATIGSCQNTRIPIVTTPRTTERLTRQIRARENVTIPPHAHAAIAIQQHDLPDDRDLLFEPVNHEDHYGIAVYAHIVDCQMHRSLRKE